METKTYLFRPDKKFFKQGYILLDENESVVYEAKMTKFTFFTPFKFQFINNITNHEEEHKVGHTLTLEESGVAGFFSTKSSFKFDGKNIWDYLHKIGIRIESNISKKILGMSYTISLKGNEIATISNTNPSGKKLVVLNKVCYEIKTTEEKLDLAFLIAFAFARTEQIVYD